MSLLENVPHERNWGSRISGRVIRYDLYLGRRCNRLPGKKTLLRFRFSPVSRDGRTGDIPWPDSKKKFESMQPYEPDFIVANCPGCAMFMDKWQYTISEMEGTTYGQDGYGIPVLTYEELTALVLGYDPWEIGLQMHQVSVEPLLDKMGIPYDPEAKFKNIRGEDIGALEMPHVPESVKIIMLNHKIGKRTMKSFIFNFQFSIFN